MHDVGRAFVAHEGPNVRPVPPFSVMAGLIIANPLLYIAYLPAYRFLQTTASA
jgi:hypothetical protein